MNRENEQLLHNFSTYLSVEKRLSLKTREVYLPVVEKFLTYMEINNFDIKTIEVEQIEEFVLNEDIEPRTRAKYLSALRSFFRFIALRGIREDNPSELFVETKIKPRLPEVHTVEEIERLLNVISENDVYGIRDKAIFELIYSAALRVSELVNLKVSDYFEKEEMLRIEESKRGKSRLVPVGERAISFIKEYMLSSRSHLLNGKKSDYMFISRFGDKMTRQEVWLRLSEYSKEANVHFTVHSLRHSYATHILQNGGNLVALKELLGHSNLRTTVVYTHLDTRNLKKEFFEHKGKLGDKDV